MKAMRFHGMAGRVSLVDELMMYQSEDKEEQLKELLALVDKSEISSIRSVVSEIIKVINDPRSNAMALKDIIEVDPPLTARVLRLANSVYYSPPKKIDEIRQAILWIGSDALKELALSQKVCEVFRKDVSINGYSRVLLWRHSLAVAVFGRMLYRREFGERGENAYAVGLLHDIGIIVEDQFLQEDFKNVLSKTTGEKKNLTQAEKSVLGYTHADIGREISVNWRFPKEFVVAIGYHHDPRKVDEAFSTIASTLYVADYMCQEKNIGYSDAPFANTAVFSACLKTLGIKPQVLDLIAKDVDEELLKMEEQGAFPV